MRPEHLIESLRWAPERSIAEDVQLVIGWAACAAIAAPLLAVAVFVAIR
jgi:hypothetical protein